MEQIRAVVVDPAATGRLVIGEFPPPSPDPSEALIRVAAFSLNLGEVRRSRAAQAGARPGWDLAGTVERAAADGSGPPLGARVVGLLLAGSWAEIVAVPTNALAVVPDAVSLAQAATLPIAGLTALYSLDTCGALLGRTLLVTGASGGVGHFACQLARRAGARVIASVRRPEREQYARDAGAHTVVSGEDLSQAAPFGPYDFILESVGGTSLTSTLSMLAPQGLCVLYGVSASTDVTFDAGQFMRTGGARLYGFIVFHELKRKPASDGLARLVDFVARGQLHPHIEVETPWTEIGEVAQTLFDRGIAGKAVLLL